MSDLELPAPLRTNVTRRPTGRTIRLHGELDGAEVTELQPLLDDAAEGELIEVDAAGLGFVDSMGLRLLVEWHRRVSDVGGRLVIRRPSALLERVLAATQLDSVLNIERDRAPGDP